MEKQFFISVLAYGKLCDMARQAVADLDYEDTEIQIYDCNVDTLPATVEQATNQGCEIFVAGAGNAAAFSRCSQAHLVEIRIGTVDYLRAIRKAVQIGTRPLIAVYRYGRAVDLPLLEELSGVKLELLQYEDSADLYQGVQRSEADVVIGASHAVEIAEELHRKHVLLYFSEASMRSALRRARDLAVDLQKNMFGFRLNQTVLSHAPFGFVATDDRGRILVFNRMLRRQTGLEDVRVQGRPLSEVVPALAPEDFLAGDEMQTDQRRLINGAMQRCVQLRVEDRGKSFGSLTFLYPDNARRSRSEPGEGERFRAHHSWKDAVSLSPAMQSMIREAKLLADQPYPLAIGGEAGVGKSFFAQCIHSGSRRAREPWLSINLAALPDQDAPRILFGVEDGSAVRQGLLELAQEGSVLLQGIGSSTAAVQSCILQVLTDGQFRRIGGVFPVPFRARFITAFNEGDPALLRDDLWQRLSVFRVEVPPLRRREEDIPALFSLLAQERGVSLRRQGADFDALLRFYSWPGNLSELSAVCQRYLFYLRQTEKPSPSARHQLLIRAIGEDELFAEYRRRYPVLRDPSSAAPEELLPAIEHMKQLLKVSNDRLAEKLSLSRTTLWRIKKENERKQAEIKS
ncbi:MAG: sigma 54-interacting transcriptional regulator [Oscillospiraceae bacterium]|nr:sigma 54-interacting transcriptional regulator [Oscillospiraceae bacterium]